MNRRAKPFFLLLILMLPFRLKAAVSFNGVSDYFDMGTISSSSDPLMLRNSDLTMCAWVYKISGGDIFQRIIAKESAGGGVGGYSFWIDSQQIGYSVQNSGGVGNSWRTTSTTVINYSVWTHVCIEVQNTTVTAYANGVAYPGIFYSGTFSKPQNASANFRIGSWYSGSTRNWNGYIDDVRVYNRALSGSEIQTLASSRERIQLTDGLVGYWPMDDGFVGTLASTVLDRSGNGHNGTYSGTPVWTSGILTYP